MGEEGQSYHVRFRLEAGCEILDPGHGGRSPASYAGAPCRTEYTIARRNLFQIPSSEWRLVFSDEDSIAIARRPSWETEPGERRPLTKAFAETRLDLRQHPSPRVLRDGGEIAAATLAGELMNARSSYEDGERGLTVTVEYPVNLINIHEAGGEFQVCTGPVLLPDLATWDGTGVTRVFLADVGDHRLRLGGVHPAPGGWRRRTPSANGSTSPGGGTAWSCGDSRGAAGGGPGAAPEAHGLQRDLGAGGGQRGARRGQRLDGLLRLAGADQMVVAVGWPRTPKPANPAAARISSSSDRVYCLPFS